MDTIHGDAFEFLRNNALDATNYFDTSKAELRRNQFGFAVGGPFLKDRLFWFSDYQGTRQVQGASTGQVFLPTDAERAGLEALSERHEDLPDQPRSPPRAPRAYA